MVADGGAWPQWVLSILHSDQKVETNPRTYRLRSQGSLHRFGESCGSACGRIQVLRIYDRHTEEYEHIGSVVGWISNSAWVAEPSPIICHLWLNPESSMGYESSMGCVALAEERTSRRFNEIVAWKAFHSKGFVA